MKKLLLILAACCVMVACKDEEKKADNTPNTPIEYFEAMYEAANNDDEAKFIKLAEEAEKKFGDELTEEQQAEFDEWCYENMDKVWAIEAAIEKWNVELE